MEKWQIKNISITNIGPFSKTETLSFLAPSKEMPNDLFTSEEMPHLFLNKIKYKFNNIVGIFGPNASGKTQFLEAFKNYLRYNSLNQQAHMFALKDLYLSTNNNEKKSEIKVEYISSEGTFVHTLTFTKVPDEYLYNFFNINDLRWLTKYFSEKIYFVSPNEIIEPVYDSNNLQEKNEFLNYSFVEMINYKLNLQNMIPSNNDVQIPEKQKEFFEIIARICQMISPFVVDINQNWDSKESDSIHELITLALNYSSIENQEQLEKALKQNKITEVEKILKKPKKFITEIARICDPKIKEINFNLNIDPYSHSFSIKNIYVVYDDNSKSTHPITSLSSGTMNLMITFLRMYCEAKQNPQAIFIFDELGKSWHSQLLTNFLVYYATTPLFKDTKIIFTSHHPEVGDILRTDAVWFISKNHKLESLYNFKNQDDDSMKRNKFSKNYNDTLVDIFSTSPSITDFENIDQFF